MRISDWSSDVCSSDLSDGYETAQGVVRAYGGLSGALVGSGGASPDRGRGHGKDRDAGSERPDRRGLHLQAAVRGARRHARSAGAGRMRVIDIFTTGGMIDKVYFDALSEFQIGPAAIPELLSENNEIGRAHA